MLNRTENTSIKKIISATISTLAGFAIMSLAFIQEQAQAIEIWSDNSHKVEIAGDFHYGLFHTGVSLDPDVGGTYDPASVRSKGELDVKYNGTLNSQIDFGFKVEAKIGEYEEGVSGFTSFRLDENYIFLKSPLYGELVIGSDKGAAGDRHVRAPESLAKDLNSIEGQDFKPLHKLNSHVEIIDGDDAPKTPRHFDVKDETDIDYDEDVHKIIYYTPRLAGLQFGVSYAPRLDKIASGENDAGLISNDDGIKNGVALHISYEIDLGAIGAAASFGYLTANKNNAPDPSAWNAGAGLNIKLGPGALKIGGGYLMSEDFRHGEENVFIIGTAYQWDQWMAGIHYRLSEHDGRYGERKVNEIEISGSYRFSKYFAISAMAEYGLSEITLDRNLANRGIAVIDNGMPKSEADGYSIGTVFTVNF